MIDPKVLAGRVLVTRERAPAPQDVGDGVTLMPFFVKVDRMVREKNGILV